MSNICRICLIGNEENESLFESPEKRTYKDMIKEFIGIDMVQYPRLPYRICITCSLELKTVVKFVSKCLSSCGKIQQMLKRQVVLNELSEPLIKEEDIPLSNFCSKKDNLNTEDNIKNDISEVYIKEESVDCDNINSFNDDETFIATIEYMKKNEAKNTEDKSSVKKTKRNPLLCRVCGVESENLELAKKHQDSHKGDRSFICPHCGRAFTLRCTLREHIGRVHMRSVHMAKMSCICDLCGKVCYRKNDLNIHMRTHTKEKPYKCKLCGDTFSQGSSLSHHMRRHTGERPFSCHICGKGFVSQSGLKTHMSVHSEEKNHMCQVCGKGLKSSKALKQHLLLHSSHKPNICEVCGIGFAQKVNLKKHIIAKHSERSGTCEECKKTFSNLSEHIRVHTGEKPFNCSVCGKGFPRQRHLTTHLRRHREATKFPCTHSECDAAFPMQCQLDFHVLKFHTKYFPFICNGCNKGFYRLADLNKHKNANNYCKKLKQNIVEDK